MVKHPVTSRKLDYVQRTCSDRNSLKNVQYLGALKKSPQMQIPERFFIQPVRRFGWIANREAFYLSVTRIVQFYRGSELAWSWLP